MAWLLFGFADRLTPTCKTTFMNQLSVSILEGTPPSNGHRMIDVVIWTEHPSGLSINIRGQSDSVGNLSPEGIDEQVVMTVVIVAVNSPLPPTPSEW